MTQQLSYFYECTNVLKVGIENSSRTPVNTKQSQQNYSDNTKINAISVTLWICLTNKMFHENKFSYQKCSFLHLNFKSRQQYTIAVELRIAIKEAIQCRNCLESGSNDTSGMGEIFYSLIWVLITFAKIQQTVPIVQWFAVSVKISGWWMERNWSRLVCILLQTS